MLLYCLLFIPLSSSQHRIEHFFYYLSSLHPQAPEFFMFLPIMAVTAKKSFFFTSLFTIGKKKEENVWNGNKKRFFSSFRGGYHPLFVYAMGIFIPLFLHFKWKYMFECEYEIGLCCYCSWMKNEKKNRSGKSEKAAWMKLFLFQKAKAVAA